MKFNHTPGPWSCHVDDLVKERAKIWVESPHTKTSRVGSDMTVCLLWEDRTPEGAVCRGYWDTPLPNAKNNAWLISKSPEMFDLLVSLTEDPAFGHITKERRDTLKSLLREIQPDWDAEQLERLDSFKKSLGQP